MRRLRRRNGVVKNLATFNIVRVAIHEWIGIAQDLIRAPRQALGWLFGPPGWSPDGSRETSAMIKARAGVGRGAARPFGEPEAAAAKVRPSSM